MKTQQPPTTSTSSTQDPGVCVGVVNAVDDKSSVVLTIDCVRVVDTLKVTVEDENVDVSPGACVDDVLSKDDEPTDVPSGKHPISSIS